MEKLGFIGGTVLRDIDRVAQYEHITVENRFGSAEALVTDKIVFIQRHGLSHTSPPHRINHKANLLALKELGARQIVGVCSVGGLHPHLEPGTLILPDDYIGLWSRETVFDDSAVHTTPRLDAVLSGKILEICEKKNLEVHVGGIYFQTTGPRLETKAEISMIKNFADVVGMTMADEATVACELGLRYASVCSIDNYANGVQSAELSEQAIRLSARSNAEKIKGIVAALAETFSPSALS